MKTAFIVMSLLFATFQAGADVVMGETLVSCTANAAANDDSVIKGYTFDIIKEEGTGFVKLVSAPICLVCMVVPTIIDLPVVHQGSMVEYFAGHGFFLEITMESFVPTKTHPGTATLGDKTLQVTCESK